jgi:Transglycosylase-like domain
MRNHRWLITYTVAALCAVTMLIGGASLAAVQPQQEATSWTSSHLSQTTPSQPRTDLLTTQSLAPLAVYATAVVAAEDNEAAAAYRAAAARLAATSYHPAPSMSPTTSTTSAPATSGGSNSAIWSCIISHESGGDPTAVNPSSGDGGLFQFNVNTWLSNGGGQYAPNAQSATPAQQWAIAIATQAADGWSPWIGDGCTPLG